MGLQKAHAQSRAQAVASYGKRQLDRVISPAARQNAYKATMSFASERPILFAFIASQLFFSLLPLVLFVSFAASVSLFALVAAVVFALFWVGVAMVFLVPTLFLTCSFAVLVWLWAASAFVVARWVYGLLPASARGSPPPARKQVAPRNGYQDGKTNGTGVYSARDKTNGDHVYTGGDTEYRDALVKSENGDTE